MRSLRNLNYALLGIMCIFSLPCALSATPVPLTLLSHTSIQTEVSGQAPGVAQWLKQHSTLRVGVSASAHPPFQLDTDPADFEGITADYLALLAPALGVTFQVLQYPNRQAAIAALDSAEVDMITGDPTLADAHPSLLATDSYLTDRAVLVGQLPVQQSQLAPYKTLVYVGNNALQAALHEAYPQLKLIASPDYYNAFMTVINDESAAMWTNAITAEDLNRRMFDKRLVISRSHALPVQDLKFITRRDLPQLASAINKVLNNISPQTHSLIAQTWGLKAVAPAPPKVPALTIEEADWVALHPELSVFVVHTHIPLTYINDDGEESGYASALLKKMAAQNGITLRWHAFSNVIEMRNELKKSPDALIAVADASAHEDPDVIFSRPYQISNWVLVTRKSFPQVKSLSAMNGKKVAVFTGTYYLPALRKQFPEVQFVEEDFSLETALSLVTHRIDGAIVPQTSASFVLKSYLEDRFRIATILPLPPLRLAMATSVANRPLLSIIDKMLRELPPRTLDAQLNGWQMRYALERFEAWGRYRTTLTVAAAIVLVIVLMLAFYYWRNRFLKRNLETQQKLQNELKATKRQVEKASASKSVFLSQMSHEIRTPLNALIGLLELENMGKSSPEQRRNNIAVAYESSKSLLMLVGDILDMAKIESGTFLVRQVPVSLGEILNNVSTLFRYSAEDKGLTLLTQLDVQTDRIICDPLMLTQIASNLLSNAIKFTPQGEVEMIIYQTRSLRGTHAEYVLEVCDSGPGLTPEQQTAIFEPFVQVDSGQTSQTGTGLGLSICRQLAGLLNGALEVDSTPGEGTTFIFRFSAPPDIVTPAGTQQPGIIPATTARKILLVDDHAPNRMLLAQQLEYAGHHSVAAENGAQALRLWLEEDPPFDTVITDCNMPGMSGFELVRQLREQEKLAGRDPQPMFGLTAMAEQKVKSLAAQAGMTDCLFKPVELARLLACIEGAESAQSPSSQLDSGVILSLDKLEKLQPEMFNTLILAVIKQNEQDMSALQEAIEAEDFAAIRRAAHSLVGGAHLIEAAGLAQACQTVEIAAEETNLPRIKTLAATCVTQIMQLDTQLKQVLDDNERNDARES